MEEFLNKIILGNSIREYFISILIVLIIIFIKKLLSKYLAGILSRIITQKDRPFNRSYFQSLVHAPIEAFLIILAIVASFHRLNYPDELHFNIWKIPFSEILESVSIIALIISFIWLCIRTTEFVAIILHQKAMLTNDRSDDQLIVFFKDLLKVVLGIIGLLLVIKYGFHQHLGGLVTGISIVGAALALAFRESLENLIASFVIFFDRPFTVGDMVKVLNVNGTVEKIGLRSTRIRTVDKTFVTVPNKQMVDTVLDNQSLRTQRKVENNFEISLAASPNQLQAFIKTAESILKKEFVVDATVFLSDTGQKNNLVHIEYYTAIQQTNNAFFKLREEINLELLTALRQLNLEFAEDKTTVEVRNV